MLGGEYDYLYLLGMLMLLFAIMIVMILVFLRLYRRKQGRKPRSRMKPMKKFRIGFSSEIKDQILAESEEVSKFVFRHDSGIVIGIGRRGKRRLFLSVFWAKMYARLNFHLFEASEEELANIDLQLADDVEIIDEGEELKVPN